jgi:pyruvate kinase
LARRTKIVCTLGPAVATQEKLAALMRAGMNVARLNCSHGEWEEKRQWIDWIRGRNRSLAPVGIMADLQGPKFRIGSLDPAGILIKAGQIVTLGHDDGALIPLSPGAIWDGIEPGRRVLLGDGDIELKIQAVDGGLAQARVISGGVVHGRRGITVAHKSFLVPCITTKDLLDIRLAAEAKVDFIALSYVRSGADMMELREIVDQYDPAIRLVAKVETPEALKDIDGIIRASDVVMVARGDLGLQMSMEDVPVAQKRIIHRCAQHGRPVITATQMLESMITNPRPTRAEASDVANAIFDGTDAVMLSGETAAGAYPIEAVETMARIARKAETMASVDQRLVDQDKEKALAIATDSVAASAVKLADALRVKAIVCSSTSGMTPRLVSRHRPAAPIYCCCWNERTQNVMSMVWGVKAVYEALPETSDQAIETAINAFVQRKKLKSGDRVLVVAGIPAGQPGHTNLILVRTVD